jgi:predicted negative regulator of RcsB-dependent stress response
MMESLLGLLVFLVVVLAFLFGWQSYKNYMLSKQIESMSFMYDMVANMYTTLIDTVMMHEGIDITPYIEQMDVHIGGVRSGKSI